MLKTLVYFLSVGSFVKKKEKTSISQNARWFDDYYTIEYLDKNTIAIGEPRYWQKNYSYLIMGSKKAILFDSGPGVRNIEPIIRSITALPIISMCSHFHYDHVGNINRFEDTLLCSNQLINQLINEDNSLVPSEKSFLGKAESYTPPTIENFNAVEPHSIISLGDRNILVIPTPGHSKNSISLLDRESKQLFIGDFLVPSILLTHPALVPDGNLSDTKKTADLLINLCDNQTMIYSGHTKNETLPLLSHNDLIDLSNMLNSLKSGFIPKYKKINTNMSIIY